MISIPRWNDILLGLLLAAAMALGIEPAFASTSRTLGMDIRVAADGWGPVSVPEIETALYAVADELITVLPAKLSVPILVSRTRGNPVALYDRGPNGEYLVRLHASGNSWPLYVYEFAHELCHVLSNHDQHAKAKRHNQWFEETLCETASLYALRRVAGTWELAATSPIWAKRAPRLRTFYDRLMAEETRRLPDGTSFAAWMTENEHNLRANPYLRAKNDLVAKRLLPLFESDPKRWRSLAYMNLDRNDPTAPLPAFLANWNDKAPVEHRGFISELRATLAMDEGAATPAHRTLVADVPVVMPGASAGPVRERAVTGATER